MEVKNCSRCGPQPVSAFARDKSKADGLHTRCNPCRRWSESKTPKPRTPEQLQDEAAIAAAKDRLAELFPTQFARLVLSERRRAELVG